MTKMTINEYVEFCVTVIEAAEFLPPHLRAGQFLFTIIHQLNPDMANDIADNSGVDPFYKDSNIKPCLEYILNKHVVL